MEIEEELRELDLEVKQLRLDYERYFLGTRPREPSLLRSEVQKKLSVFSNTSIQNTAQRFKLSTIVARYQALKRQWDETLRKIEAGTYERHRFKADLHSAPKGKDKSADTDLFAQYREARPAEVPGAKPLTREKLDALVARHRAHLAERFGPEARFRFRIAFEDGRTKLKASRIPQEG